MKKISKIKLNQFSKDELDRRKMNALKGGCECRYSCDGACPSLGWGAGYDLGVSIGLASRLSHYVARY